MTNSPKMLLAGYLALVTFFCSCSKTPRTISVRRMKSPAPDGSLVPQVTRLSDGRVVLSWQERLQGSGYTFAMAIRSRDEWSSVRTIATGPNLSMFSADLPGIAELPDGALLAYWELKDSRDGDPYATAIQTSVSRTRAGRGCRRCNLTVMPSLVNTVFSRGFRLLTGLDSCGSTLNSVRSSGARRWDTTMPERARWELSVSGTPI